MPMRGEATNIAGAAMCHEYLLPVSEPGSERCMVISKTKTPPRGGVSYLSDRAGAYAGIRSSASVGSRST
jgi:hypothetical protein